MNELGECYICTLESAPLSPCDCINMYLHYNCQIKLIHEKGEKCTVCLKEFNNVEVITKINYYYTFHTKSAFCMIILGIIYLNICISLNVNNFTDLFSESLIFTERSPPRFPRPP